MKKTLLLSIASFSFSTSAFSIIAENCPPSSKSIEIKTEVRASTADEAFDELMNEMFLEAAPKACKSLKLYGNFWLEGIKIEKENVGELYKGKATVYCDTGIRC